MGKGYSGGKIPEIETQPIAPVNPPVSESAVEVAAAAKSEKEKLRKAFSSRKTVIAGGSGLANENTTGNRTLG